MAQHPETELIAFSRGELVGRAHDRIARHVQSCPACRAMRDDLQHTLDAWRHGLPEPPAVDAVRYRAEVRQKLRARYPAEVRQKLRARYPAEVRQKLRARYPARPPAPAWWRWPVPLALSVGLTGVLLFLAVHGGLRPAGHPDGMALDEAAIAPKLELLRNYALVERLDLLEDFDILRSLASQNDRRES